MLSRRPNHFFQTKAAHLSPRLGRKYSDKPDGVSRYTTRDSGAGRSRCLAGATGASDSPARGWSWTTDCGASPSLACSCLCVDCSSTSADGRSRATLAAAAEAAPTAA